MHFCLTPYQTLSEGRWLGTLQMTAVTWWVSEILMRVSQVQGCILWKHRGGECLGAWLGSVKGQPYCCLWLKREVPLCQHKPKVTPWVGREQRVCTKCWKRGTFTHRGAQHLRSFVQMKTIPKECIHSGTKYSHPMQFFLVFPKKTPSIE